MFLRPRATKKRAGSPHPQTIDRSMDGWMIHSVCFVCVQMPKMLKKTFKSLISLRCFVRSLFLSFVQLQLIISLAALFIFHQPTSLRPQHTASPASLIDISFSRRSYQVEASPTELILPLFFFRK